MEAATEMVVPPGVSGIDHGRLHQVFTDLDDKIQALAQRIETYRQWPLATPDAGPVHASQKCQLICRDYQGDRKLRCLQQCVTPVVGPTDLQALRPEFPIDLQRLDQDLVLRQHFERHQRAPDTIAATDAEASLIADMYAMPLATAALPDTAWDRALDVLRQKPFTAQREALVRNWTYRGDSYSPEAKEELARKLNRHDRDGVFLKTAQKLQ